MVAQVVSQFQKLIDHPEHVPLIIIRPHYLDILGGKRRTQDVVAGAALLGVFEYWTALRKKKAAQDPRPRPGWEWIVKSIRQLSDVLLGMFGTKTLRAALKLLSERGLISIRENAMLKVDRKHQYKLEVATVRGEIERWISSQQVADSTTAHWAFSPTDKSLLPNGGAELPTEAAKMPDDPAESAGSVFRESSLETPSDNHDLNDSVAAATGGEVSSEESALTYDSSKPEKDPTPSPDEMPPTTPVPPPPSSPQAGVPDGYVMRYAGGSGRTAHLVHVDATETACGSATETLLHEPKPGRGYSMCPRCAAKVKPIVRKPSIDQPVKDAIAEHLQAIPVTMATSYTGVLANIALNVWKRKLGRGLGDAEYGKVARSVAAFVADYQQKKPSLNLPTSQAAFEENFTKFVAAIKSGATQPEPPLATSSKPRDARRSASTTLPHGDVPPEELTDEQLKEKWS